MKIHRSNPVAVIVLTFGASLFFFESSAQVIINADSTLTETVVTTDSISIDPGVTFTISSTGNLSCSIIDFQDGDGSLVVQQGGSVTLAVSIIGNENATIQFAEGSNLVLNSTNSFETGNLQFTRTFSENGFSYGTAPIIEAQLPEGTSIYEFNESQYIDQHGSWLQSTAGGQILAGKAYAFEAAGIQHYNGTPNTSPITLELTITDQAMRGNVAGFHLLGNPYTAPLDLDSFFATQENTTNSFGNIYVWNSQNNDGAGSYEAMTNGTIASGQGFFIQLDHNNLEDGIWNLNFDPDMMVATADNSTFVRQNHVEPNQLVINFSTHGDLRNRLTFKFDDAFTTDFDKRHDAYSFDLGSKGKISAHAIQDNRFFDILALPLQEWEIPIQINMNSGNRLDIGVEQLSWHENDYQVILHDKTTGESLPITPQSTELFSLPLSSASHELTLSVSLIEPLLEAPLAISKQASLFVKNNEIVLINLEQARGNKRLVLYNLSGQMIKEYLLVGRGEERFQLPENPGQVLIARYLSADQSIVYKIVAQ